MDTSTEKTEQPTPKKLRDARKRGEVFKSPAVSWVCALAVLPAAGLFFWDGFKGHVLNGLMYVFRKDVRSDPLSVLQFVASNFWPYLVGLPLSLAFVSTAISMVQTGGVVTTGRIGFGEGRFDPGSAVARWFKKETYTAAVWGLLSATVVAVTVIIQTTELSVESLRIAVAGCGKLQFIPTGGLWWVVAVCAVVASADLGLKYRRHRKTLMMTRQEIIDEQKEMEGDPFVKAKRRRMHRQAVMNPMKKSVKGSRVVIVNPTRFAVAVRYEEGDEAPVVAFKGEGFLASRIREVAEESGVPVVRDAVLARGMYYSLEIEDEIDPLMYETVAAVFHAAARAIENGRSFVSMD